MNYIWIGLIIISLIFGVLNGNLEEMLEVMLSAPKDTLELLLKVGGMIIFYSGIFKIAVDSGVIKIFSKLFSKVIKKIFSNIPSDHIAIDYISANIVSNLLGLGIASAPMAIKAYEEMKKINNNKDTISSSMIIFLVINVASFTLFPVTVISIREVYLAKINIQLIPLLIILTFINTLLSVFFTKIVLRKKNDE